MDNKKLYRDLFLIDDTRIYTNDFYIFEFVKIVLFRAGYITLTLEEIQKKITELTSLEYTIEDIEHSISSRNYNGDLEITGDRFSLSSFADQEMKKREKSNDIKVYIAVFLDLYKDEFAFTKDDLEKLIEKFIYQRFNENLEQIADIFNHCLTVDIFDKDYTDEEKQIINEFLNWDHPEKNKCVYTLIAKAYDYCMINSKCENSTIDFSKIQFYLDTNILFRMMGINGGERETSIKSLIEKSHSAGIKLAVTNFVREECEYTISSQIEVLKDTTVKMNKLFPPSTMSFAEEKSVRIDFYKRYYNWVLEGNKHRNYDAFKNSIMSDFRILLDSFDKDEDNASFRVVLGDDFQKYYDSLYEYKQDKHTTETDINSSLLILDKRKEYPDMEYFLISADQKLISWSRDIFPGYKAIVDFPSAWLSIILKYRGREKESDYKAFCQFIHLSIEPKVEDLPNKIAIKASVMSTDLDDDIKVRMIDEVKDNYSNYKSHSSEEVVHIAYARAKDEIEKEAEIRKDEEYTEKIGFVSEAYERKLLNKEKEYKKLVEDAKKAEDEAYERGKQEAHTQIKNEEIENHANKIVERNQKIRKHLVQLAWVLLVIAIFSWFFPYLINGVESELVLMVFYKKHATFISGGLTLLEIFLALFNKTVDITKILPIDKDMVLKKIK